MLISLYAIAANCYTQIAQVMQFVVSTDVWNLAMTVQQNEAAGFYILNLLINIHVASII